MRRYRACCIHSRVFCDSWFCENPECPKLMCKSATHCKYYKDARNQVDLGFPAANPNGAIVVPETLKEEVEHGK